MLIEDDASTIRVTRSTHYTNTCVKLTIVPHVSYSERIAIAKVSLYIVFLGVKDVILVSLRGDEKKRRMTVGLSPI